MRLTAAQAHIIKTTVDRVLGVPNQVWLFGSRTDDNLQGGDIDLLVEVERVIDNRSVTICSLYGALIMALGDRKLDLILKDTRTVPMPVFDIAHRTGILL